MKLWMRLMIVLVIATFLITIIILSWGRLVPESEQIQFNGSYTLHFINVSQGDAILIVSDNNTALVDCGDNAHGDDVVNYLESNNITKLDYLITTHPDADHIGGCDIVMKNITVEHVWDNGQTAESQTYADYITLAKTKNHSVIRGYYDIEFNRQHPVSILVISPVERLIGNETNDNSIVLHIFGAFTSLLAGDCTTECEQNLLNYRRSLSADVLKIGHHGSYYSTTNTFLDAVNPEVAVISVGAGNQYGHPSQETLDKLVSRGIMIKRTDVNGNIVINSDFFVYSMP